MATKYIVNLTEDERTQLLDLTRKGQTSARKVKRAHILLRADEGAGDTAIAEALHTSPATVHRTRQRCVENGLAEALNERPRPGAARKLDGKSEAHLVALTCSDPPAGRACWTMQLLADKLVELKLVETVSDETVRRVLKNTTSSPGRNRSGAFPR